MAAAVPRGGDRMGTGRTCVHSSSGTHPPSRSCRAAAERHKVQGSPAGCVGLGTTRGFVPLRVQQSHSTGFGIPGQALQWWHQAGSSRGGADCDKVLRACARPGRVAELEPRAPQHLQGCQVLCGAGIGSFPPQPLMCPPEAAEPVPKRAEQTSGFLPQVSPECPNKEDKLVQKKPWA